MLGAPAGAVVRPFEATLTIDVPSLYSCLSENVPPGEFACGWPMQFSDTASFSADVGISAGDHITALAMPGGVFQISELRYLSPTQSPALFPLNSFVVRDGDNAAGSFGPNGGIMPLAGSFRVCFFSTCHGMPANLSVPLSLVGVDETGTANPNGINTTVLGAPWTTGTITVEDMLGDTPIAVHGSAAPGRLDLVTPIYVGTNLTAIPRFDFVYARLTLQLVPEPGTAALLGLGALALAAAGRSRRG
jgi:hypothetical protein